MSRPRISVVIPTRDRPDTLKHAVATVRGAMDRYPEAELIVCENPGGARTMTDNWELAVSRATGEYVTVLGDDDGLTLHALEHVGWFANTTKADIINSTQAIYSWPGVDWGFFLPASIPTRMRRFAPLIEDVQHHLPNIFGAPSLYNSFVHRDVLDRIRAKSGRLFGSVTPDWYSAIALAVTCSEYLSVGTPLRLAGISPKSNGYGASQGSALTNGPSDVRWHDQVPRLPYCAAAIAAEVICQVNDRLGVSLRYNARAFANPQDTDLRSARPISRPYGLTTEGLSIEANAVGVANVHQAAVFVENLLRLVGTVSVVSGRESRSREAIDAVRRFMRPVAWKIRARAPSEYKIGVFDFD